MQKTILIVDDSVAMRAVTRIALERAGYAVLEAGDGKQGLAQLEKVGRVNLIVSDVNMPVMNGIEFLTELKRHARLKFVPVIMLTTENQKEMMDKGRAAGAKAWIVKPFNPPQLLDAVSKLVTA